MFRSFLILLLWCNFLHGALAQIRYPIPHPEGYVCYQPVGELVVDGVLDESSWEACEWTNSFVDIEGSKKPDPYLDTRVKMLWDSQYFYFAARMEEPQLWATLKQRDTVIFFDNDIEIFIDPDGDTHGYYELEMNAFNTLWDLLLPKPYREGGPAIDHWDINGIQSGVALYGTLNDPSDIDSCWTVEVAIPWDVLEEYASHRGIPEDGEQWRISYSRVHYDLDVIDGKYEKRKDEEGNKLPEYNWVWTPQWVINMHRPETWGYVQFETEKVTEGNMPFQIDPDFDLKMAMYEIYLAQKVHAQRRGYFSRELATLSLSPFNRQRYVKKIRLTGFDSKYILKATGQQGVYTLDEEGRLRHQKGN